MDIIDSFREHFASVPDSRVQGRCDYALFDLLTMALLAVICGADGWKEIAQFTRYQQKWLSTVFDLSAGCPSETTFSRVIGAIHPRAFRECFTAWMHALVGTTEGKLVAIDGKTARRSFDRASAQSPLHVVRAWVQQNHLVLGQVTTDAKSNEITAIPELLKMLDLRGATVSIDAMGTQKTISNDIVDAGADYLLALKDNHPKLMAEVKDLFADADTPRFAGVPHTFTQTTDEKNMHGRHEVRRVWCSTAVHRLSEQVTSEWANLASLVLVTRERTVDGITTHERAYYLSSLTHGDATLMAPLVRNHWSIENSCHWNLDMSFREDECRIRKGHGPENIAILRSLALSLLKQAKSERPMSIVGKRKAASWNHDCLLGILSGKM
jgi:predicted transposase YbfD/YdcC